MPSNHDIISGFYDDYYEGRGLSRRMPFKNAGIEVDFADPPIDGQTVSYVKTDNNINTDAYDTQIGNYIKDALNDIEKFCNRTIVQREVTAFWKRVNSSVNLPYPDVNSITSVTAIDDDGNESTLTTDDYTILGNKQKWIHFNGDALGNQIKIVYNAGYGTDLSDIPQSLQDAISAQTMVYYSKFAESVAEVEFDRETNLSVRALSLAKRYKVY